MKVALIGGTHGNEKIGAWLLAKWKQDLSLLPTKHDYFLDFGNPKALSQNTRYVDFDLNRSFNGGNPYPDSYEYTRAQELTKAIENWALEEKFFLIDLHTTTSNMGASFIISDKNRFNAHMLNNIKPLVPESNLVFSFYEQKNIYLSSLTPYSVMVEVGAVPQNLLSGSRIELMEQAVLSLLKVLPDHLEDSLPEIELEGFLEGGEVSYPGWQQSTTFAGLKGQPSYIHPSFQGQDFKLLKKGDPIFKTLDGKTLYYEDDKPTYPTFINEAAYYEKGYAYTKNTLIKLSF